jgi:hypothetical protein
LAAGQLTATATPQAPEAFVTQVDLLNPGYNGRQVCVARIDAPGYKQYETKCTPRAISLEIAQADHGRKKEELDQRLGSSPTSAGST